MSTCKNLIFSKTTNCTCPMGEKIYSCLFIPSCTRNHVITYTNNNNYNNNNNNNNNNDNNNSIY